MFIFQTSASRYVKQDIPKEEILTDTKKTASQGAIINLNEKNYSTELNQKTNVLTITNNSNGNKQTYDMNNEKERQAAFDWLKTNGMTNTLKWLNEQIAQLSQKNSVSSQAGAQMADMQQYAASLVLNEKLESRENEVKQDAKEMAADEFKARWLEVLTATGGLVSITPDDNVKLDKGESVKKGGLEISLAKNETGKPSVKISKPELS